MFRLLQGRKITLCDGDGTLVGLDAMITMAQQQQQQQAQEASGGSSLAAAPPFPRPVLMIVSGHKIDAPQPDLGIIVAQKPLKQADFVNHLNSIERFLI
jgi:hypothetical protein